MPQSLSQILLLLLATATLTAAPKKAGPDETLSYKKIGEVDLKLHIFNPEGHKTSDRRPAIVFFFGGGWNSGTASQFHPQCAHLASRGMVAISADYRVAKTHGTTPRECVQDGKSAIRWVRQHAKELGIDPERLAAGGGSAGGQVAAATGTLTKFEEEGEDLQISSRPNALVLSTQSTTTAPKATATSG
jgi:acetyl esterase